MSRQMTIRGVPEEVSRRLAKMSRERGESVNTTVVRILEEAAGIDGRRDRLMRYVTWTDVDLAEFEQALAAQRVIDADLWR